MMHTLAHKLFYTLLGISCFLAACVPASAVVEDPQVFLWRSSWNREGVSSESLGLETVPFATGLKRPVGIEHAGDSDRLFVLEQEGRVMVVEGGEVLPEPFLDLRDKVSCCGEQGLLGFAAHPDYARNGLFFVSYTDTDGDNVIARYRVSADPDRADPASEEVVLTVPQPSNQHNAGALAFGPDGYLYISIGDGDYRENPQREAQAQDPELLLGKILRIDVDALPYHIPPDNPFVDRPEVLDEIWALGLRNPWRFSFDEATGDMYIADVGQNRWEEVNVGRAGVGGENYGWPWLEGEECFGDACDPARYTPPALAYPHEEGCSVSGGPVYRGRELAGLQGAYLYGDFCSGRIWAAAENEGVWRTAVLFETENNISSFGTDASGEVYFADYALGTIYRIVPHDGAENAEAR